MSPLLRVEDLAVHFPVTAGVFGRQTASVKAVDGVSFEIESGRTLGLVGESGCGKSTVGRAILRLLEPTAGRVIFEGQDITHARENELRDLRTEMQIIFQDPFASLNPRMTVLDIVGESLTVHGVAKGAELERRVVSLLSRVGIPSKWVNRYPHEFSGGQRQRISIARAIALEPKLVVCDEAVSALDVSIQAQVINLLIELRREMGLAYLFISHDLSVVRHISDEIAVMYLGEIVERAPTDELFRRPVHPYTRALLSAIPKPDPRARRQRVPVRGDVPSPLNPPEGCRFHTRCPLVMDRCRREHPPTFELSGGQRVGCFLAERLGDAPESFFALPNRAREEPEPRQAPRASPPRRRETPPDEADAPFQPPPAWRLVDVVAGALSAAFLFAGEIGVGMLLAIVALVRIGGRNGLAKAAVAAAALVFFLFVGRAFEEAGRMDAARRQLGELTSAIEAVSAETGSLPLTLGDLGWRLPPIVGDLRPLDPWGRPWQYERTGDAGFVVGSFGPDGSAGGDDDVGELPTARADRG